MLKHIRLEKENAAHLKQLAKKYKVSETLIINLFLGKSRDPRADKESVHQYITSVVSGRFQNGEA